MLQPGSNLGPYRILEQLGRGGMATVYKAYESALDRDVALKVLPAEYLAQPEFAERFRREATFVAKLEHPNIVPVYAFGVDDGHPWMAMRFVPSGSLAQTLATGAMSPSRTVEIVRAVANALAYAHQHGVVHRDIKPQNILLDKSGTPYLADFGIARMLEDPGSGQETQPVQAKVTKTGMILGTPEYMAPEQARGGAVDHRADIYALGVVAYEALTGRVPFSADTPVAVLMKHLSDPIPLPDPALVPELAQRVILKALAKSPADRWESAGAFATALAASLTGTLLAAPAVERKRRPPFKRLAWAVTALIALGCLALGAWTWHRQHQRVDPRKELRDRVHWTVRSNGSVSFAADDVDVVDFLLLFGDVPGVNVLVDGDVKGRVSAHVAAPWEQAFQSVLRSQGLSYARMSDVSIVWAFRKERLLQILKRFPDDPADACWDLQKMGSGAKDLVAPVIRAALPSLRPGARQFCAKALVAIAPDDAETKAALILGGMGDLLVSAGPPVPAVFTGDLINFDTKRDLPGASIATVMGLFADISGLNVIPDAGLDCRVHMRIEQVPWDGLFDAILKSCDLGYTREENAVRVARLRDLGDEAYVKRMTSGGAIPLATIDRIASSSRPEATRHDATTESMEDARRGCDAGIAANCTLLGNRYSSGDQVPKDLTKAAQLYRKACDGGHAEGCNDLAVAYANGDGAPRDAAKATQLYEKACDGGDPWGCGNLAEVTKDATRASQLYQKACDGGRAGACFYLAGRYAKGEGVPKDAAKATQLYQKACDEGSAGGCVTVGSNYFDGNGVTKDEAKGAQFLQIACDDGGSVGCFRLGDRYEKGEGVPKDAAKAAQLYYKGGLGLLKVGSQEGALYAAQRIQSLARTETVPNAYLADELLKAILKQPHPK